jgi:hypothetical protein
MMSPNKKYTDPLDYILWWCEFNTRLGGDAEPVDRFTIMNAKDELKRLRELVNEIGSNEVV